MAAQDMSVLFVGVVSIGELETRFTTMQDAARRVRLEASLERYLTILLRGVFRP